MIIKILGSCCGNCDTLEENAQTAVKEMGLEVEIVKITDVKDIMTYGVMTTPALVIDEKVVSYGKVLSPKEIIKIIESAR